MRKLAGLLGIACALVLSTGSALGASAPPPGAGANWASHAGGADEGGYSRLSQVDAANVGRLGLVSWLDLPGESGLEATPLAVDGVLYFTGSHAAVYAVDAVSGRLKWRYDPETWKHNPGKLRDLFPANRGVAYASGRVFVGTLDGRLIALDARTGKPLWSVQTVPADSMHTSTGAPRTFRGKVIIGNGGADFGMRGYVTAYDQATGKQLWRFYTVPGSPEENKGDPAMERAARTWSGQYWKTGTGGTVWNGITFDPELDRIYIGTGNAGPYDPAVRSPGGGDNLYLVSIVALDANTGKYIWHYQMNPREAWDYKATANIVMATVVVDGKPRKVLLQAPTNGFFYVLDRITGKVLSAEKLGKVTWADHIDLATGRPVEAPNIRYETGETIMWPSPMGAHNWQDMSFDPQTGLAYIPYMQLGARYATRARRGDVLFGGFALSAYQADAQDGTAALLAWDPATQTPRWKVPLDTFWNGGVLSTAGGLVFQGAADGYLSAYDARTGRRLWRFDAGLGITGAPISYTAGGRQYVSVLVGYSANIFAGQIMNAGWKYGAQPRRLLTFALDGKAALPPGAPPDKTVHAVDDPAVQISDADVQAGYPLYTLNCAMCHGLKVESPGAPAPDLRESQIALDRQALWSVLHDGALLERGMPRFQNLTPDEVGKIHAYIRAAARRALNPQAPVAAPAAGREVAGGGQHF